MCLEACASLLSVASSALCLPDFFDSPPSLPDTLRELMEIGSLRGGIRSVTLSLRFGQLFTCSDQPFVPSSLGAYGFQATDSCIPV